MLKTALGIYDDAVPLTANASHYYHTENLNLDDNRLMQTRLLSEIGNLAKLGELIVDRSLCYSNPSIPVC